MSDDRTPPGITRVVGFHLPLHWILGVVMTIAWAGIGMYFAVGSLTDTVSELRVDVKAGNAATALMIGELTMIKYRISTLEGEAARKAAGQGGAQ
jgi:hypothetical protein